MAEELVASKEVLCPMELIQWLWSLHAAPSVLYSHNHATSWFYPPAGISFDTLLLSPPHNHYVDSYPCAPFTCNRCTSLSELSFLVSSTELSLMLELRKVSSCGYRFGPSVPIVRKGLV